MILISSLLFIACGDKTQDSSVTSEDSNNTVEDIDTNTDTDAENNDTNTDTSSDTANDTTNDDSENSTSPTVGSWTVSGPEFTINTCGGGESFPNSRSMTLGLTDSTLTLFIEEAGERSYAFNCILTGSTFSCDDIEIENPIPMLPCTLYYTHTLQGVFPDDNAIEGEYSILTTSSGGSGCSESNLGFATPCEQSGLLSGNSNN